MSYDRAVARVIVDKPNADGRITTVGLGRDWIASDQTKGLPRFTPDIAADFAWKRHGRLDYIASLRAIGPCGTWARQDMVPANWTMVGGWEPNGSPTAGNLQQKYLWYYDATPGHFGYATSNANIFPNFVLWMRRMGKPPDESIPALVGIVFLNAGLPAYSITWPQHTNANATLAAELAIPPSVNWTSPTLWGHALGETYITPIAELNSASIGSGGETEEASLLRFEYADDHLIIRAKDDKDGFAYGGRWTSNDGQQIDFALQAGQIRFFAFGQPCMFNLQPITYPDEISLIPASTFHVAAAYQGVPFQQTPQYRLVGSVDTGTTLSVAQGGSGADTWPVVTFGSTGERRSLLYRVQEYRSAVIGDVSSAPVDTATATNFTITQISGRVDDTWRGASVTATVVNTDPVNEMASLFSNGKCSVSLSCDNAASYATMFTGYILPPEKSRTGGQPGWIEGSFQAEDIVTARLSQKHILWQSSFGGNGYVTGDPPQGDPWSVESAFKHLLNCAGVPEAVGHDLIYVSPTITPETIGADYYMPAPTMKGESQFAFSPDTSITSALDAIVTGRTAPSQTDLSRRKPMRWGVNEGGAVFLTGAYEHAAGKYYLRDTSRAEAGESDGWVIDADTATVENWPLKFRSTRNLSDFRNFLWLLVGDGIDAAASILIDSESLSTQASYRFIGDLWTHFEHHPELTSKDCVQQIALDIWERMVRQHWLVQITLDHWPGMMPDDEGIVTGCADLGIPDSSIFKIVSKDWSASGSNLRYSQTLDAVLVEEGAGA